MNSEWAELVVDDEKTPAHEHEFFNSISQPELTTPQLRKLVFYRGVVRVCHCGCIEIDKTGGTIIYSRNGNRVS